MCQIHCFMSWFLYLKGIWFEKQFQVFKCWMLQSFQSSWRRVLMWLSPHNTNYNNPSKAKILGEPVCAWRAKLQHNTKGQVYESWQVCEPGWKENEQRKLCCDRDNNCSVFPIILWIHDEFLSRAGSFQVPRSSLVGCQRPKRAMVQRTPLPASYEQYACANVKWQKCFERTLHVYRAHTTQQWWPTRSKTDKELPGGSIDFHKWHHWKFLFGLQFSLKCWLSGSFTQDLVKETW